MDEKKVTNYNELRDAVALINEGVLNMCNASTTEEVLEAFTPAKDLLVAVFKYNVIRVSPHSSQSTEE